MGRLDNMAPDVKTGCPSGLQETPVADTDPMGAGLDLSPFVINTDTGQMIELIVQGAHCAGCMNKIEKGLGGVNGITHARMNLSTLRLKVEWDGGIATVGDVTRKMSELGFGVAPYQIEAGQTQAEAETRGLLRAMAVAGFAAMNVMLLSIAVWSGGADMDATTHDLFHWISAVIALPTVAYAGQPFFRSAFRALKSKTTNMDVPISLALILACALSVYETVNSNPDTYFDAAVMLLFLLLIGRYLDARLRRRTGEAARALAALQVSSATRILDDGRIETVAAAMIVVGDRLLIPSGQRLAVDAVIEKGTSDFDMHIATGETDPVCFTVGDSVYSGTTNLTAPLTVRAIAPAHDSFLSEISALVEAGEQSKSRFVKIADRAARAYVPVVHTLALLTFVGWLVVGADLRHASLCAIAVLIITCPCALGLAVPAVQIVAAGRLFKAGVLLRSGDALERLAKTRYVVFDKTGTLTQGRFSLLNGDEIAPSMRALASSLAAHSSHPKARALVIKDAQNDIDLSEIAEIAGQGLSAIYSGERVKLGSQKFAGEGSDVTASGDALWLRVGCAAPIRFVVADTLRRDAADTLSRLRDMKIDYEMVSGDARAVTQNIADQLGIDKAKGEISPKGKLGILAQRMAEGRYPLMVGDGINDAPALAAANSSASLAGAADIARSAADIILQGDKLAALPRAIIIAKAAQRRVVENLSLAVIYNMLAIPLAVFGFVNPLIAALAMSGSSLLVTLNALRMMRA